jgi:hypothetical protein
MLQAFDRILNSNRGISAYHGRAGEQQPGHTCVLTLEGAVWYPTLEDVKPQYGMHYT